jgi:predicted O-methyltransferase YrrM
VLSRIKRFFLGQPDADDRWGSGKFRNNEAYRKFRTAFQKNLSTCEWEPHPQYSVFTQYDQDYYLRQKDAFLHKYKCFYAVSKTVSPRTILELGTHAGSSADAYISATPTAQYIGLDLFGDSVHQVDKTPWRPQEVAERLFASRRFTNYRLIKANLRELERLPANADFVVVDAAHDFENEYADLRLALSAEPQYIFVDDSDDPQQAQPAIDRFLRDDLSNSVDFLLPINYIGGGLVIKLKG